MFTIQWRLALVVAHHPQLVVTTRRKWQRSKRSSRKPFINEMGSFRRPQKKRPSPSRPVHGANEYPRPPVAFIKRDGRQHGVLPVHPGGGNCLWRLFDYAQPDGSGGADLLFVHWHLRQPHAGWPNFSEMFSTRLPTFRFKLELMATEPTHSGRPRRPGSCRRCRGETWTTSCQLHLSGQLAVLHDMWTFTVAAGGQWPL